MKYRKAEALFHYAIMITIVALALAAMHTYLRRSIQAKVKDLTDNIICESQLASLNDPVTEKFTRDINSAYSLQRVEGTRGISSLNITSAYTVRMEHEVENLEKIDYGQAVSGIKGSLFTYIGYGDKDSVPGDTEDGSARGSR